MFPWEKKYISSLYSFFPLVFPTIIFGTFKEYPELRNSCALVTRQSPYYIIISRVNLIKRYYKRHTRQNSLFFADNFQEFFQMVIIHELGHLIHGEMENTNNEKDFIAMVMSQPRFSQYSRDGWRDLFAELYTLHLMKPHLFTKEEKASFWKFINIGLKY